LDFANFEIPTQGPIANMSTFSLDSEPSPHLFPQSSSQVNAQSEKFKDNTSKWKHIIRDFEIASALATKEGKNQQAISKHTSKQVLGAKDSIPSFSL
jgi:hypothetical protein